MRWRSSSFSRAIRSFSRRSFSRCSAFSFSIRWRSSSFSRAMRSFSRRSLSRCSAFSLSIRWRSNSFSRAIRSFSRRSLSARAISFFLRSSSILRCCSSNFFFAFSSSSARCFNSFSFNFTSFSFSRSSFSRADSSRWFWLLIEVVDSLFLKLKVFTCFFKRPKKDVELSFSSVESVVFVSTTFSFSSFDIKKILSHTISNYYIIKL